MVLAVVKEESNGNVAVVVEENNRIVAAVVVGEEHNRNLVVVVEVNCRIYSLQNYINAQHATIFSVYILLLRS